MFCFVITAPGGKSGIMVALIWGELDGWRNGEGKRIKEVYKEVTCIPSY